jgi:toxin ParE1/3/4
MVYRLSVKARDDLQDIAAYIITETGIEAFAEKTLDAIFQRFELLARNPRVGRMRDDLKAGVRSFPVDRYIIVYRIVGGDVRILRVASSSRDLKALMRRGS